MISFSFVSMRKKVFTEELNEFAEEKTGPSGL